MEPDLVECLRRYAAGQVSVKFDFWEGTGEG